LTDVEFHTHVADPVGYTCRLLRKACRAGARVLVTAPESALSELDERLWTFDAREFLPHVRMPGARSGLAARTPVWLAERQVDDEPRIVLNLGAEAPAALDALQRLIEVVSAEPDEAERGRSRWRAYRSAGLQITHHAVGTAGE
jgi:DNA polymerase-3 subunit chi